MCLALPAYSTLIHTPGLPPPLFARIVLALPAKPTLVHTLHRPLAHTCIFRDHYGHYVKCPPNFEGHEKCEKSMYSVSGNKWMCPQTDGKYAEGGTPTLWDSEETQNQGGDVVWTELGTACGADCANVYDNCLDAFMIWSTPFLTSLVYFILSFTFYFLNPEHKEASTGAFMKMFMIICFLFWVASSLAAGSADITSALMAFIMVALFAGSVVGIGIHGVKTFRTDVENNMVNKFREQYGAYGTFFKGMLVLTCGPIILFYWAIASVNQAIRKLGLPLTKTLTDEDKNFALTLVAAKQKEMIRGWKWTPVLTMAIKIGMFVQVRRAFCPYTCVNKGDHEHGVRRCSQRAARFVRTSCAVCRSAPRFLRHAALLVVQRRSPLSLSPSTFLFPVLYANSLSLSSRSWESSSPSSRTWGSRGSKARSGEDAGTRERAKRAVPTHAYHTHQTRLLTHSPPPSAGGTGWP